MTPTPLQKQFDFYWPCVDIRVYISSQIFAIPSPLHPPPHPHPHPPPPPPPPTPTPPTHTNTHTHTPYSSEKRKLDQLSGTGTVQLRVSVHRRRRRSRFLRLMSVFLYSNTAVICLTTEPSLDSSFGNWMSKAGADPGFQVREGLSRIERRDGGFVWIYFKLL